MPCQLIAGLCLRGSKIVLENVHGTKSENLFLTLCYCYIRRLNQSFRGSLLSYKDKGTIKTCKRVPRGGKKLASCCSRVAVATPCHPVATDLSPAGPFIMQTSPQNCPPPSKINFAPRNYILFTTNFTLKMKKLLLTKSTMVHIVMVSDRNKKWECVESHLEECILYK